MKTFISIALLTASAVCVLAAPDMVGVSAAVDDVVMSFEQDRAPAPDSELAIFLLDVERGTTRLVADKVSTDLTYCGSPSWSADGRRILFDATPGQRFQLARMQAVEVAGGALRTREIGVGTAPTESPDGKRIAWWLNSGAEAGDSAGLWIMKADGSARTPLRVRSAGIPKWSPDGKRLLVSAFVSPVSLDIVDLAGRVGPTVESISLKGGVFYSVPSWAGDGTTMVAVVKVGGVVDFALIDVSKPDKAVFKRSLWRKGGGVSPAYPVYHPGTGQCVFAGRERDGTVLYSFCVGEEPQRIDPNGCRGKIASLAFSPDGRYVLFCSVPE